MTFSPTSVVRVAMVDSGAGDDATGPELAAGRAFFREDAPFVPALSTDVVDRHGHGADCTRLVRRLAPDALLVPLRIFGSRLDTSPAVLCAALEHALEHDFDVVNLSLSTLRADALVPLFRICHELRRHGTIVVAAADPGGGPGYPAIFDDVLGVAVVRRGLAAPASIVERLECIVGEDHLVPPAFVYDGGIPFSASRATAVVSGAIAARIASEGRRSLDSLREEIAADRRFLLTHSAAGPQADIGTR